MDVAILVKRADIICDYVPLVSTIANLTNIFHKTVTFACLVAKEKVWANKYFTHVKLKEAWRCVVLLIPVLGNIIIAIYDIANRKNCNKEFVIKKVTEDGNYLKKASPALKHDPEVVRAALKKNGLALEFVSEFHRNHIPNVEIALSQNPAAFKFVGRDAARTLIVKGGSAFASKHFEHASAQFQDDQEIVGLAVKEESMCLQFASPRLRKMKAVVDLAMAGDDRRAFKFADREVILEKLKEDNSLFRHLSDDQRNDSEFAEAIQGDKRMFYYVGFDAALYLVSKDGLLLKEFPHLIKQGDLRLEKAAINNNSFAIEFIKQYSVPQIDELQQLAVSKNPNALGKCKKQTKATVLLAVGIEGCALQHASSKFTSDDEVCEKAISNDLRALKYTSTKFQENQLKRFPLQLQYAKDNLRDNESFVTELLQLDGMALEFASVRLRKKPAFYNLAKAKNPLAERFAIIEMQQR